MAKETLSVASSEPVSLTESQESTKKNESNALKAAESKADKNPAQNVANKQDKSNDDDLEEVTVDDIGESKAKDGKTETSGSSANKKEPFIAEKKLEKDTVKRPESGASKNDANSSKELNSADDADAPPRPTRPVSPLDQIKRDLKEAFPQIEDKYIQAVVIASEGRVDPAFNALLFLLDPSFKPEPVVVAPKPVEKTKKPEYTDDELLARHLQKEFDREERKRRSAAAKSRQRSNAPVQDYDSDSPDEIDQLKEQFTQGFEEAKSTINGWVSGLTKKFSQDADSGSSSNLNPKLFGALGGSSFNSGAKTRTRKFDEDPEILSLDFSRNVDLKERDAPRLPRRTEKPEQEQRWQPLNSDVPVSSDAFLLTDLEDEDKDKTKK